MVVQYQGEKSGVPTTFTLRIIGNNISKRSSNYQIDLLVGDKPLPFFTTSIHQSLYNCLKEVYLFSKYNHIKLNASSEEVAPKLAPYDAVLFDHHKHTLFMA